MQSAFHSRCRARRFTSDRDGIPRTINVICNNALIAGFARGERPVGRQLVSEVCDHLDLVGDEISAAGGGRENASQPQPNAAESEPSRGEDVHRREVVERLLRRR